MILTKLEIFAKFLAVRNQFFFNKQFKVAW